MIEKSKIDKRRFIVYILFALGVFFIAFNVPYCHDEWQWGSDANIELAKNGFDNYNGRYLGNILALIVTRSILAKALIMTVCMVVLLYVLEQILFDKRKKEPDNLQFLFLLCSIFMLFSLPYRLFRQSYGWIAAFVNFVPPVILFLVYYFWTREVYGDESRNCSKSRMFFCVLIGIATQLFSEHVTLFVVVYAVWILLFNWLKKKKVCALHVWYLVSTVAGMSLMFSNSSYRKAAEGIDGHYKQIGFSLIDMIKQFCTEINKNLFLNNYILNLAFAIVIITVIIKLGKRSKLDFEMIVVVTGYSFYSCLHRIASDWAFVGNNTVNACINTFLSMLFFCNILLFAWRYMAGQMRIEVLVLMMSAVVVALPLLVANPIGARCFYMSYILEGLALLMMARFFIPEKASVYYPILLFACFTVLIFSFYIRIFASVGKVNHQRAELIAEAIETKAEELTLPRLPYESYFWMTVPPNEAWEKCFREFYHIPENTTLHFE